jgi:hypothetical protein
MMLCLYQVPFMLGIFFSLSLRKPRGDSLELRGGLLAAFFAEDAHGGG